MAYESEHSLIAGLSNDTVAQANLLNNGVITIGSLSSLNDVDYYKIDTDGAALITLSFLTSITLTSSVWTISLLDFSGADYLLSPIRTFTTSPLVDGANQASSTLDVKGLSTLPPVGSRFTLATDGADTTIYMVVSATPLQGDTSTITLDNAVANPANGAALVFDPVSSSVGSSTTVQALVDAAGTYYIKVVKGDVASTQEYSVTATVTSTDEHESNDTKTDAAESNNYLLNGIAMTGNLSDSNDNDVWLFTTTTTADVTLDFAAASGNAATPEWAVSLKEWSGQTVPNNTGSPIALSAGVSVSATATNAAAKTYMVTVAPTNPSTVNTGTYTLKISGATLDLNNTPVMSVGTVTSASTNTVIDTGVITSMEAGEHSARLLSTLCSATDADSGQTLSYFVSLAKSANATSTASIKVGDTLYCFSDGMASPAALWLSAAQMATATLYAGTTTGDVTLTLQAKDNSGAQDGSDYGAFMKQTLHIVADTTLPTLTSSTPADDAAHVLVGSDMTLTFSEAVQAGTGNIVISDGTDIRTIAVTDSSQVTFDGSTVTINPTDDLHAGSSYHVEMANSVVEDLAGNAYAGINDATTLDFMTSPVVGTYVNPANNHTYIWLTETTWTQAEQEAIAFGGHLVTVNDAAENAWLFNTFGNYDNSTPAYSSTSNWIGLNDFAQEGVFVWASGELVGYTNFYPGEPNNSGDSIYMYGANPPSGAPGYWDDWQGTLFRAIVEIGAVAPTLISVTPSDNASEVPVHNDIVITFSEAIKAGAGAITLTNTATGAAIAATISIVGDRLVINPNADLDANTHYAVTIANNAITDLANNNYAGTNTYDFTTGAEPTPSTHDLTGNITFWKGGAAISDVTTTLSAMPIVGTQLVEFRDIHTNADGSHTVEIWVTSSSDIASLQLEFMLSTGAVASWNSGDGLPTEWMSVVNTATGQFQLASITGAAALPAGTLKLGTLTVASPTSAEHVELLLNSGTLGNEAVATTGIVFDTTTTSSDGSYHYLDVQDGLYSLMAERAAGVPEHSAVTAVDALAALKMAVGLNPNDADAAVSPYQYLAADVNHDGKVRANDALNILKMAVGLESAPEDEWIFVPESVGNETMTRSHVDWSDNSISVTLDADQELDLIGVVKGDVDGSWAA